MRASFIGILFLLSPICCKAQELFLEQVNLDSIYSYDADLGNALYSIYYYNALVKMSDKTDTIIVLKNGDRYAFSINGKSINGMANIIEEMNVLYMSSSKGKKLMYHQSLTYDSDSTSYRIFAQANEEGEAIILLTNYMYDLPCGIFTGKNEEGLILSQGEYMFKDSIYIDTITTFHYETYEEQVDIIPRSFISVKCGPWIERDSTGRFVETLYQECKK